MDFGDDFLNDFFGQISHYSETNTLDRYWKEAKIQEYCKLIEKIKASGRRVFRNSEGKHKIV